MLSCLSLSELFSNLKKQLKPLFLMQDIFSALLILLPLGSMYFVKV